jgi:hypothetical protein
MLLQNLALLWAFLEPYKVIYHSINGIQTMVKRWTLGGHREISTFTSTPGSRTVGLCTPCSRRAYHLHKLNM